MTLLVLKVVTLFVLLFERPCTGFTLAPPSGTGSSSGSSSITFIRSVTSTTRLSGFPSFFSALIKTDEDNENNSEDNEDSENTLQSEEEEEEKVNILRQIYDAINQFLGRKDKHFLESSTFVATPLSAAIASFFLYPTTSIWFHSSVNALSRNNWESVDGGQLQWSILLPALNGVVMTAISLLYANLISTTGTQLRSRQITIHSSLSQEVEGLRGLTQLLAYYPQRHRVQFANFIQDYLQVLVDETDPDQQQRIMEFRSNSPPLFRYRDGLHAASVADESDETRKIQGNILERSYETLQRLLEARNTRITSMQTRFPSLHYVTITALSTAILLIFLLETDRKVILFLDKFQIRLVWSLLVGTLTAIYCIGIDLTQPFIGTYTVPAEQLVQEDSDELMALIQNGFVLNQESITTTTTTATSDTVISDEQEWQEAAQQETLLVSHEATSQELTPELHQIHASGDVTVDREGISKPEPHQILASGDVNVTADEQVASKPESHQILASSDATAKKEGMSLYEEYMRSRNQ